ncbi:MAG: hypothetical protein ACWGNI_10655, partial [Desulfobacterales bacterium]
ISNCYRGPTSIRIRHSPHSTNFYMSEMHIFTGMYAQKNVHLIFDEWRRGEQLILQHQEEIITSFSLNKKTK